MLTERQENKKIKTVSFGDAWAIKAVNEQKI